VKRPAFPAKSVDLASCPSSFPQGFVPDFCTIIGEKGPQKLATGNNFEAYKYFFEEGARLGEKPWLVCRL
jgi:hypothetical protein